MATLIASDIGPRIDATDDYWRSVAEANRKLAERNITRIDYRGTNDGLRRFIAALEDLK